MNTFYTVLYRKSRPVYDREVIANQYPRLHIVIRSIINIIKYCRCKKKCNILLSYGYFKIYVLYVTLARHSYETDNKYRFKMSERYLIIRNNLYKK